MYEYEAKNKQTASVTRDPEADKAYVELAKFISNKYGLSLGKLKLGFKKYGLSGLFERSAEFGLTEDQRNEIESIYILATQDPDIHYVKGGNRYGA
ncbi:MAG: hypothetical protein PHE79_12345 [Eubacteriales bacterium]|nr:hypothetical protein [Eubacteriales bacterium]